MQKQEFEERIERTVTDEQYKVIEEVYMWHPSIRNTSGKDEVAELYKSFGIPDSRRRTCERVTCSHGRKSVPGR